MRRPATLLLTLVLVAAACGDDSATTTTAPPETTTTAAATTTLATTTTAAPTTTVAPTTTLAPTTTAPAVFYAVDPTNFFPDVFGAAGDPHGSGCVVGADVLPAGVWFGFAKTVGGGNITFDLACFFTGAAAAAAATADGAEVFDFYIRNQNPKVYTVPISPSAEVWYVDMITGPEPAPLPLASWPTSASYVPCPGDFCAVWLYINGGVATGIVEQYLP